MAENSLARSAELIAAGISLRAHAPADIPALITETHTSPAEAVQALKAAKPHLFKAPNAMDMTRDEYRAAKASTFRAIARTR